MSWLVSVENGEDYSDHSTTPVAVCTSEEQAKMLQARIMEWIAELPMKEVPQHDGSMFTMLIAPYDDAWPVWMKANPWPVDGGKPPDDALNYRRRSKAWICEVPAWART